MQRTWRVLAAVVLVAVVALAACSDGGGGGSSSSSGGGGKSAADDAAGRSGEQAAGFEGTAAEDRSIVYTATLTVRVGDAAQASDRAADLVDAAGGYVAGQDADLTGLQRSTLTARVPSARFRALLDDLGALGTVRDRGIESTEVTDEVVDLTGRLKSAQTSAVRLRTLVADAGSTGDIIAIEQELAKREGEIEAMQGKLRVLDDRTTLATVTLHLTERPPAAPTDDRSDDIPGFGSALRAGGRTVATVGRVTLVVVGFVLPFLPIGLVALVGHRWWRRRHPVRSAAPLPGWRPPPPPAAPPAT